MYDSKIKNERLCGVERRSASSATDWVALNFGDNGKSSAPPTNAEGKDPCHCSQCIELRVTSTAKRPNPALALLFPANPIGSRVPRLCPTTSFFFLSSITVTWVSRYRTSCGTCFTIYSTCLFCLSKLPVRVTKLLPWPEPSLRNARKGSMGIGAKPCQGTM